MCIFHKFTIFFFFERPQFREYKEYSQLQFSMFVIFFKKNEKDFKIKNEIFVVTNEN